MKNMQARKPSCPASLPLPHALSHSLPLPPLCCLKIDATGNNTLNLLAMVSSPLDGPKLVETLIKAGVNPNLQNCAGDAPLHSAAKSGSTQVRRKRVQNRKGNREGNGCSPAQHTHIRVSSSSEKSWELLVIPG